MTLESTLDCKEIKPVNPNGNHHRANIENRLIIFFAAKDREAVTVRKKQDWELTGAQIMSSLLPNSDSN